MLESKFAEEEFTRWERIVSSQALDRMSDVMPCPRCAVPVVIDVAAHMGHCSACFFAFCTECRDAYHPGSLCTNSAARLERALDAAAREPTRSDLVRRALELKNLEEIKKVAKVCPSCGEAVQKSEGCNKMTCLCGTFFCYLCGKKIDGYSHFDNRCELFTDVAHPQAIYYANIRQAPLV